MTSSIRTYTVQSNFLGQNGVYAIILSDSSSPWYVGDVGGLRDARNEVQERGYFRAESVKSDAAPIGIATITIAIADATTVAQLNTAEASIIKAASLDEIGPMTEASLFVTLAARKVAIAEKARLVTETAYSVERQADQLSRMGWADLAALRLDATPALRGMIDAELAKREQQNTITFAGRLATIAHLHDQYTRFGTTTVTAWRTAAGETLSESVLEQLCSEGVCSKRFLGAAGFGDTIYTFIPGTTLYSFEPVAEPVADTEASPALEELLKLAHRAFRNDLLDGGAGLATGARTMEWLAKNTEDTGSIPTELLVHALIVAGFMQPVLIGKFQRFRITPAGQAAGLALLGIPTKA